LTLTRKQRTSTYSSLRLCLLHVLTTTMEHASGRCSALDHFTTETHSSLWKKSWSADNNRNENKLDLFEVKNKLDRTHVFNNYDSCLYLMPATFFFIWNFPAFVFLFQCAS
jgi:hypothetical protein